MTVTSLTVAVSLEVTIKVCLVLSENLKLRFSQKHTSSAWAGFQLP